MNDHTCKYCSLNFKDKRSVAKFCSYKCYHKSMVGVEKPETQKRITKKCLVCKKEFTTRNCHNYVRTCSVACGGKIRRGQKWQIKDRVKIKCIKCGGLFNVLPCKKHKIFCNRKCYILFKTENVKYPDKQRFQGSSWMKIRKLVIERDINCQDCGNAGKEVHHIIPYSITGDDSLENLVLLCKSCHLIRHQKMWKDDIMRKFYGIIS